MALHAVLDMPLSSAIIDGYAFRLGLRADTSLLPFSRSRGGTRNSAPRGVQPHDRPPEPDPARGSVDRILRTTLCRECANETSHAHT